MSSTGCRCCTHFGQPNTGSVVINATPLSQSTIQNKTGFADDDAPRASFILNRPKMPCIMDHDDFKEVQASKACSVTCSS